MYKRLILATMAFAIAAIVPATVSGQACYACFQGLTPILFSHTFHPECGLAEVVSPDGSISEVASGDCPLEDPVFAGYYWPQEGEAWDDTWHADLKTGSCPSSHGSPCTETNEVYRALESAIDSDDASEVVRLVTEYESLSRVDGHLELVGCSGAFTLRFDIPQHLVDQMQ